MALLLWRFFTYYISILVGAVTTVIHGFRKDKALSEEMAKEQASSEAEQ